MTLCFTVRRGVSTTEVSVCKQKERDVRAVSLLSTGSVLPGNKRSSLNFFVLASLSLSVYIWSSRFVPVALDVFASPQRTVQRDVARLVSVHWSYEWNSHVGRFSLRFQMIANEFVCCWKV